jgi:hypothetical protein
MDYGVLLMLSYNFPRSLISHTSLAMHRHDLRMNSHSRSLESHPEQIVFSEGTLASNSGCKGYTSPSHVSKLTGIDDDNLMQELAAAIAQDELQLHYQPIICLNSHRLLGFEALTRWLYPLQGWISPSQFIPLAEETGLILPLGEWVIRTACFQLSQWQKQGKSPDLKMSINLSPKQLESRGFSQLISSR